VFGPGEACGIALLGDSGSYVTSALRAADMNTYKNGHATGAGLLSPWRQFASHREFGPCPIAVQLLG
jgi:hypothetical protein